MTGDAILSCRSPSFGHWELGDLAPRHGLVVVLGWRTTVDETDAGIPRHIAQALAAAFVSVAIVSFPADLSARGTDRIKRKGGTVRALGTGIMQRLQRHPSTIVSTRDAPAVAEAFEDPAHPWWSGAQVFVLSDPGTLPPSLGRRDLDELLSKGWADAAGKHPSIQAVFRAGVDGDVAGLWCRDARRLELILEAVRASAEQVDLRCEEVAEEDL